MIVRPSIVIWLALSAVLALAGCQGDGSASLLPGVSDPASEAMPAAADASAANDDERRQQLAAWLQIDSDSDGLINETELTFALDPEKPTDGMDIDGDGLPNFRDPDIDGDGILNPGDADMDDDGLSNAIDPDTDGDGIRDFLDADANTDGIRDRWEWDKDSDGEDEDKEEKKKEDDDDDDEEAEQKLNEAGAAMAQWVDTTFGTEEVNDSAEMKDKYAQMAAWSEETFGEKAPEEPASDMLSEDLRRFGATLSQIAYRGEHGDPKAANEIHQFFLAFDVDNRELERNSPEARLIAQTVADRVLTEDEDRADVDGMVDRLMMVTESETKVADAFDVIFRQATEMRHPKEPEAIDELLSRVDSVIVLVDCRRFADADLLNGSDAISRLDKMSGDESLEEKVGALLKLAAIPEEKPELDKLVTGLEEVTKALDEHEAEYTWDEMVTLLEAAPGIEDGIDEDVIEYVVSEATDK